MCSPHPRPSVIIDSSGIHPVSEDPLPTFLRFKRAIYKRDGWSIGTAFLLVSPPLVYGPCGMYQLESSPAFQTRTPLATASCSECGYLYHFLFCSSSPLVPARQFWSTHGRYVLGAPFAPMLQPPWPARESSSPTPSCTTLPCPATTDELTLASFPDYCTTVISSSVSTHVHPPIFSLSSAPPPIPKSGVLRDQEPSSPSQ